MESLVSNSYQLISYLLLANFIFRSHYKHTHMASTTLGSQSNKLANTASFKSLVLVSMSCSFITKHLSSVRARESKTSLKDTHTK